MNKLLYLSVVIVFLSGCFMPEEVDVMGVYKVNESPHNYLIIYPSGKYRQEYLRDGKILINENSWELYYATKGEMRLSFDSFRFWETYSRAHWSALVENNFGVIQLCYGGESLSSYEKCFKKVSD
ncbi:hypothetical protein VQ643_15905 [Pseudomonas sp. F1_0610]|uniref:hypothetical protein n=1 Tax=Pseudomonas sp. F1_0610 TaxID=3114284 RepID=UPI0039C0F687